MARRPISEEERALWQLIAKTATPLKRRRKSEPKPAPPEKPAATIARPKAKPVVPKAPTPVAPPPARPHELTHGHSVGIDKRQAERFRRGKTPIEGPHRSPWPHASAGP